MTAPRSLFWFSCFALTLLAVGSRAYANPNAAVAQDAQTNVQTEAMPAAEDESLTKDLLRTAIDDFYSLAVGRTFLQAQADAQAQASFEKLPAHVHEEFASAVVSRVDSHEDAAKAVRASRTTLAIMAKMPEQSVRGIDAKIKFARAVAAKWPHVATEIEPQIERMIQLKDTLSSFVEKFYSAAYHAKLGSRTTEEKAAAIFEELPPSLHQQFVLSVAQRERELPVNDKKGRTFRIVSALTNRMPEETPEQVAAKYRAFQSIIEDWGPAVRGGDESYNVAISDLKDTERRLHLKNDRLKLPLVPLSIRESASEFADRCRLGFGRFVGSLTGQKPVAK